MWSAPALTDFQVAVPMWTGVGCSAVSLSPLPISPQPLCPQHHRLPSVRMPQACCWPALMLFHFAAPIVTGTSLLVVVPFPNTPTAPLAPQHQPVSSATIAHT